MQSYGLMDKFWKESGELGWIYEQRLDRDAFTLLLIYE